MRISMRCVVVMAAVLFGTGDPAIAAPHPTQTQLQAWADGTLSSDMARRRASGMAVAIVSGGRISYLNGYGFASASGRAAVDPSGTLFSLGSITKLFTATAIAQLYESRRIHSLDDPANRYLRRIQLPRAFGRDITIRNLLDHRGGFDESIFGLASPHDVDIPVASAEIAKRLPQIIRKPGEVSVYSNAGYGVLGILIEDVSAQTYEGYIRDHILKPLGMDKSFIRVRLSQPVATPAEIALDGTRSPIPQDWIYHPFIAPSAGLVSTARDMAKFMLGQLDAERRAVPGLINPDGAHLLHDRHIGNSPWTTGFGMSFFAHRWNGERVAENAGSGPGFQATLILLPDSDVGFLVMIMGDSAIPENSLDMFEVRQQFLNYYLGPLHPKHGPLSGLPLARFAGLYRNERRPHLSVEAFLNPGTTLKVEPGVDGTLTIDGRADYREIASGVFWKPGVIPFVPDEASSDLYAFRIDRNGRVRGVVPYLGMDVYTPALMAPDDAFRLACVLLTVCATGIGGVFWRAATLVARRARGLCVAAGLTATAVPASLYIGYSIVGNPYLTFGFGEVSLYAVTTVFADLLVVLTLFSIPLLVALWIRGRDGTAAAMLRNLHFSLVTLAGAGLAPLFCYYNFLGYHVP